jgi:hypothetical protein
MKKIILPVFILLSCACFSQNNKPVLGTMSVDPTVKNNKTAPTVTPELKPVGKNEEQQAPVPNDGAQNTSKPQLMEKGPPPKQTDTPK